MFQKYNPNKTYHSRHHAPVKGVIGHGNRVRHVNDPKEIGTVIASNGERCLVRWKHQEQWHDNTELRVEVADA